jgi:hypothetical protein
MLAFQRVEAEGFERTQRSWSAQEPLEDVMRVAVTALLLGGCLAHAGFGEPVPRGNKPATPAKGYELRIVHVGDVYHGIRFKPATGESWHLRNGRWEKLEETALPPAGDYDVLLFPAKSLLAFRLDRATGATWLIRGGKWVPIKEPPPANPNAPAPNPGPAYALRHVRLGNQLHVLRLHTTTGAAWHINGLAFELQGETGPVPAGEFDIKMIAGEKNWMAFRLDRKSGKTWLLQANKWDLATEPGN